MTVVRQIGNLALYQCAWFACVWGAATDRPLTGIAVVVFVLFWHLGTAPAPVREVPLIALAALVGVAFESVLVATGWVRVEHPQLLLGLAPAWMVALWVAFATTLNVSLRALRSRHVAAAALGAVGGPLAYAAGVRLGALQWVDAVPALLLISLCWALLLPLLLKFGQRFDGFTSA